MGIVRTARTATSVTVSPATVLTRRGTSVRVRDTGRENQANFNLFFLAVPDKKGKMLSCRKITFWTKNESSLKSSY